MVEFVFGVQDNKMTKKQPEFRIEKGEPRDYECTTKIFKNTLGQMEVGDSIFVAGFNYTIGSRRAAKFLNVCNKALSGKYTARNEDGGIRFWRTR